MKLRTDFVTNSSDSSFVTFNIKNTKLYDFLTELGIKIEGSEKGVFNDQICITLPSGNGGQFDDEAEILEMHDVSGSISEWLIGTIYDNFAFGKNYRAVKEEIEEILSDKMQNIRKMDESIEYGHIEQEKAFEGEIYDSSIVDIENGIKKITTPTESLIYGEDLEEFDFDGEPGEIVTQHWENGQWVTAGKRPLGDIRIL